MVIGIRATVDFAFKLVFGSPEHKRVTIHFLNAILTGGPPITDVTIQNPFLGKGSEEDKLAVLDILAIDKHGRRLNIEMQTTLPAGILQRVMYYTARLYAEQLAEGASYTSLRPAISICVLGKSLFPDLPGLRLDFRLRDVSGALLSDEIQVHLLELPKLRMTADNLKSATVAELWAYFLVHAEHMTLEQIEELFPDQEFAEAAGVLEMIAQTPEQQRLYDARLKLQLDEAARLELARDEGLREGREEGRAEGRREGESLGRIAILQELLGVSQPSASELSNLDQSQLADLAEQLQRRLRDRGQ